MTGREFLHGRVAMADRPPGKLLLGLGVVLFLANHLHAVFVGGIVAEALVMAAMVTLFGALALVAPRMFVAGERGTRSIRRDFLALVVFTVVCVGLAELVARVGYRESIFG